MRLIIADTGPVNYLILIGQIDVLHALFKTVVLPAAVRDELISPGAPSVVRQWASALPGWVRIQNFPTHFMEHEWLRDVDIGEKAAIALAISIHADLLLIDDRKGVNVAEKMGFRVTGTLGVLEQAAKQGLMNLADAFDRLRTTTFHCPERLMQKMLDENRD